MSSGVHGEDMPGRPDRRIGIVVFALVLFGAIFALWLTVLGEDDPALMLTVIPVSLLASELGLGGGIAGVLLATALMVAYDLVDDLGLDLTGYLGRIGIFAVLAILVGSLSDRSRALRSEQERAAAELQRAREREEEARTRRSLVAQVTEVDERARLRVSEDLQEQVLRSVAEARQDLAAGAADHVGLERARAALDNAAAILRRMAADLHPALLDRTGLEATLATAVRRAEAEGGFRGSLSVEPEARGVHDQVILSVVRELLTNVSRHADAERVSVAVRREGERIVVEVADDGRGMAPGRVEEAFREGHIGLAAARERVSALGGGLEVTGEPEAGTVARAWLPNHPAALPAGLASEL